MLEKRLNDLFFFEYFPLSYEVWNNKNKINLILEKNFYINRWTKDYELNHDLENWVLTIERKEFFTIEELKDEAFLKYKRLNDGNYYIENLENNTNISWLWVILINSLKRLLKKWESINLFDCSIKKNWYKLKNYYKKQWFKGFFWDKKYIKKY